MENVFFKALMKGALLIFKFVRFCKRHSKKICLAMIAMLVTILVIMAGNAKPEVVVPDEPDASESSIVVEEETKVVVPDEPDASESSIVVEEEPSSDDFDLDEGRSTNYTSVSESNTDPLQNVDGKKTTFLDMCVAIEDANDLKKEGIEIVCLRGTRKNGKLDTSFDSNYKQLVKAGIEVDVYKFSYATSYKEAKAEAENLIKKIKNYKKIEWIWFDVETDFYNTCSAKTMQSLCNAFGKVCEKNGYKWGVYCSTSLYLYNNHFVGFNPYTPFWIADWSSNTSEVQSKINHKVFAHQWVAGEKTKEKVKGVAVGSADLNVVASESKEVSTSANGDGTYATELDRRHAGVFTLNSKTKRIALYGTTQTSHKEDRIGVIRAGAQLTCWGYIGHDPDGRLMYYVEYFDTESGTRCEGFAYPNKMKLIMDIDNVIR